MNIDVRQLRKDQGLTQAELGEKMGCLQNNISFLESGNNNTSDETIAKLISLFGEETVMSYRIPDKERKNRKRMYPREAPASTEVSTEDLMVKMQVLEGKLDDALNMMENIVTLIMKTKL